MNSGAIGTANSVIARSSRDEEIQSSPGTLDCFGGACHRARIRATRWLAMTELAAPFQLEDITLQQIIFRHPSIHEGHST